MAKLTARLWVTGPKVVITSFLGFELLHYEEGNRQGDSELKGVY